ncbi:MAG: tetratricopeptide repeat protein, partial [Candidatus Competibacteraceae bacterium]|nr:tetratricopeptide repeat protein [Candidatus Competibacteraceae bacterium]
WWNLGRINLELGSPQQAITAFDQALALKPNHIELLLGKITACRQCQRLDEALTTINHAQALAPRNGDVLLHKGDVLYLLGKNNAALETFTSILHLRNLPRPKRFHAFSAIAALLVQLGSYEQALEALSQGLALTPNSADLLLNRSTVLLHLRRYEEALTTLAKLATLSPVEFDALGNKAQALSALGRFDEAESVLRELRNRYPDELRAWEFYLPSAWVPVDAVAMGYTPERLYFNALCDALDDCDWQHYHLMRAELDDLSTRARNGKPLPPLEPFRLLSLPCEPQLQLIAAQNRAQQIERCLVQTCKDLKITHSVNANHARLRIGYVSTGFGEHPTAHLTRSLFQHHDHQRFEVFGYSLVPDDGSIYRQDIAKACDHFLDLASLSNAEAAQQIARDGIHILVDLSGYIRHARPEIFALRPAPVQASYLAYPGTMGAEFIDYIIADRVVLPEDNQQHYTEVPVYLPDCYQVNDDSQPIATTGLTRSDQGLPENAFVFCCFNASNKIEPGTFVAWMRILQRAPNSVLWLLDKDEHTRHHLRHAARQQAVDPQRLIFAPRLPKPEHLERHQLADLFLDTFIYNAHTTASDALWAGLPVLTLCGETFPARVCASLLFAIGLSELVTDRLEDYVNAAVAWVNLPEQLAELRIRLNNNRRSHPLFNTGRLACHLECAFELMWTAEANGKSPKQPINVPSI